jgi:hypothetical protein
MQHVADVGRKVYRCIIFFGRSALVITGHFARVNTYVVRRGQYKWRTARREEEKEGESMR